VKPAEPLAQGQHPAADAVTGFQHVDARAAALQRMRRREPR